MQRALRKLASLDARSVADIVSAQVALLRAWRIVKTRPIGSLTTRDLGARRDAAPSGPSAPASNSASGDPIRARAIALAVNRAADYGLFRPYCLVQALALRTMLEREGIRGSEIRVGVRRAQGKFAAHAWVKWGDLILGDSPEHVATFTEVDDIRVLGGA